ncbi:MAG: hypothetical protein MK095_00280 [Phycisphaerales bacterium]|nr:hypothetical protein [Phycisphaerales bacterium]
MSHESIPTVLSGSDGPEVLDGRVVVSTVSCERCGYDVRGLPATGACPECGRSVQSSLARWIDPEFHQLPQVANPTAVAFGLWWLATLMLVSFLAWAFGMVLTQTPFLLFDTSGVSNTLLPGWFHASTDLGGWLLLASPACSLLAIPVVFALTPLRKSERVAKAWKIIGLLLSGLVLWTIAMVLQLWIPPGGGLHHLARAATDSGHNGSWELGSLILTLSPLPGGCLLLFGFRSLLGELGRRSRLFRTATTKRQYVLDLIWATLFWTGGIVLQYGGGGMGVPLPVTFGSILRTVAGGFLVVGVLYLWLNLRWISTPLATPPPKLRSLLSDPPGEAAGPASSAGNDTVGPSQ